MFATHQCTSNPTSGISTTGKEDTDVLMLYSSRFDGIEDPDGDANRQLGVGDLRAQAWFEPFGNVTARDPHRGFRR
ncbi:hypothetical protein ACFWP2_35815 [Kitasatospora sp. NPDC058444]|uniref:hypothetical protein n=1 Tax=Kitasatospora sp. NPDC058444 TaxID=3346504 RepID=UPI00364C5C50